MAWDEVSKREGGKAAQVPGQIHEVTGLGMKWLDCGEELEWDQGLSIQVPQQQGWRRKQESSSPRNLMPASTNELFISILWQSLSGLHSCLCLSIWLYFSSFFHLPFTVHPFLVHLSSFVAFTFSLLLPSFHYSSNYKYSCVSVPMASVSLVILLFFLQSASYIQLFEHRSFFYLIFSTLSKGDQGAERGNSK